MVHLILAENLDVDRACCGLGASETGSVDVEGGGREVVMQDRPTQEICGRLGAIIWSVAKVGVVGERRLEGSGLRFDGGRVVS